MLIQIAYNTNTINNFVNFDFFFNGLSLSIVDEFNTSSR